MLSLIVQTTAYVPAFVGAVAEPSYVKVTVLPTGLVVAVADFAAPSYVADRLPRETVAVPLPITKLPVALP